MNIGAVWTMFSNRVKSQSYLNIVITLAVYSVRGFATASQCFKIKNCFLWTCRYMEYLPRFMPVCNPVQFCVSHPILLRGRGSDGIVDNSSFALSPVLRFLASAFQGLISWTIASIQAPSCVSTLRCLPSGWGLLVDCDKTMVDVVKLLAVLSWMKSRWCKVCQAK